MEVFVVEINIDRGIHILFPEVNCSYNIPSQTCAFTTLKFFLEFAIGHECFLGANFNKLIKLLINRLSHNCLFLFLINDLALWSWWFVLFLISFFNVWNLGFLLYSWMLRFFRLCGLGNFVWSLINFLWLEECGFNSFLLIEIFHINILKINIFNLLIIWFDFLVRRIEVFFEEADMTLAVHYGQVFALVVVCYWNSGLFELKLVQSWAAILIKAPNFHTAISLRMSDK